MVAPTVTIDTTPGASPRAEVVVSSLPPGGVTHTIFWTADDRTFPVQGGVNLPADTPVLDFAIAFGVPVTYRAEVFNAAGDSIGFTEPTTIVGPASKLCWIHNPFAPDLAVGLEIMPEMAATVSRPSPADVLYPEGSDVGVRRGSGRRGVVGAPIAVRALTADDAQRVQDMLGTYSAKQLGILVIRTPPPVPLPRVLYASVTDIPVSGYFARRLEPMEYQFTVDEVSQPAPGLGISILSYDDLDAAYPDYDTRDAAYPDYQAMDTDYSLAGYADG